MSFPTSFRRCLICGNRGLRVFSSRGQHLTAFVARRSVSSSAVEAESRDDEIVIPKYIQRSPTDILMALNSTVRHDGTIGGYGLLDDPFLSIATGGQRLQMLMSREAGQQAARWLRDSHNDLFQHRVAEPFHEKAFSAVVMVTDDTVASEQLLAALVEQCRVQDCIDIFNKLYDSNAEVSQPVLHELLDLLCFFNCRDDVGESQTNERFFLGESNTNNNNNNNEDNNANNSKWLNDSVAELVFKQIQPPTRRAYNSFIKGLLKYKQSERASAVWTEMTGAGMSPYLDTYNVKLDSVSCMQDNHEAKWTKIKEVLSEMAADDISPDVGTLNSCLAVLSSCASDEPVAAAAACSQHALDLWRELCVPATAADEAMVVPSLGSYAHLVNIFYSDHNAPCDLLPNIVQQLQGQRLSAVHSADFLFFSTLMRAIGRDLKDGDLAEKVDELLNTADNRRLLGNSICYSAYYRSLLSVLCQTRPPALFFSKYYDSIVPSLHVVETNVLKQMMLMLSSSVEGAGFLARIWSDVVARGLTAYPNVVAAMTNCLHRAMRLATNQTTPSSTASHTDSKSMMSSSSLVVQLADLATSVFERVQEHDQRQKRSASDSRRIDSFVWSGTALGQLLRVLCVDARLPAVSSILHLLATQQADIMGTPDPGTMQAVFSLACHHQHSALATTCLCYMSDADFTGVDSLAERAASAGFLSDQHVQRLQQVGLLQPFTSHQQEQQQSNSHESAS